jgi:hypothetical protein
MAGHLEEARDAIARVRDLTPAFRISDVKSVAPYRRPDDLQRYVEAFRKAGLPE